MLPAFSDGLDAAALTPILGLPAAPEEHDPDQSAAGPNVLFVAVLGWNVSGTFDAFAAVEGIMLATRWARELKHTVGVRAFTAGMAPPTLGL